MKFKAQNTIEIITAASVVAILVLAVFLFYGSNNRKIAQMTEIKTNGSGVSTSIVDSSVNETDMALNKTGTETAGSLQGGVDTIKVSSNVNTTNSYEKAANIKVRVVEDEESIIEMANDLIDELKLSNSKITAKSIDTGVMAQLMNVSSSAKTKLDMTGQTSAKYNNFSSALDNINK